MVLLAVMLVTLTGGRDHYPVPFTTPGPGTDNLTWPLYFEANNGQVSDGIDWRLRGPSYTLNLAAGGLRLTSPVHRQAPASAAGQVFSMQIVNANLQAPTTGLGTHAARIHYFKGRQPAWLRDVPAYHSVRYSDIYRGIDLVYHSDRGRLEYDFVVAPGADPGQIRLGFDRAESVTISDNGDLVIDYPWGRVTQRSPRVFQEKQGQKHYIAGTFRLDDAGRIGFRLAHYDAGLPLIIDPVLVYASFYGGTGDDRVNSMVRDTAGNLYLTGVTTSTDFPVTSGSANGDKDVFVTKLDNTGALVYAVYIGGTQDDFARDIVVDSGSQEVYLTGATISDDFPASAGAYDDVCNPETAEDLQTYCEDSWEAFVVKLDNAGAISYASYLGGTAADEGYAVGIDGSGNAYVAGTTKSVDFPVTGGVVQTTLQGNGNDMFVAKFNTTGTALTYSTYLGGTQDDVPHDLAVDATGNVYLTGFTLSDDYPTQGAYDASCAYDGACGRTIAGKRAAVAGVGGAILTGIPDDPTWTLQASGTVDDINDLIWGNGQYTVVGDSGTILTSVDGATWTDRSTGTSDLSGLVRGGGQFVAVGDSGTILTSPDSVTWTDQSTGTSNLNAVTWSGSEYTAVGASGTVLTSPDGVTWTAQTSGTTADLNAITWDGSQFVAVGAVGTLLTSADASSWTARTSGTSNNLYAIAWSGLQFAVAGASGTILTSVNGTTWTVQSSGVTNDLLDVDWGTNGFGISGTSGMILTSQGGVNWDQWASGTVTNLHTLAWSGSLVSADAVVTKLNSTATALTYSTYLGGAGYDFGTGIRLDGSDRAYIAGYTLSDDLATAGAYQESRTGSDDAFVARFDATGANLDFLTYLGGRARDIAEDLAVDGAGNIYVTGYTYSTDFPSVNDVRSRSSRCSEKSVSTNYACNADMFVARLQAGGGALDYSFYFGDVKTDIASAIAIDTSGADTQLYVAGYTNSTGFPVTTMTTHADADSAGAADQSDVVLVQLSEASGDLGVAVNDAADPVTTEDNISYSITVTNNGGDDVHGVVLTDQLPGGVSFVSATPAQGSCSETNGVVSCQLGTVTASANVAVTVIGTPRQDGDYTNQVAVTGRVTDTVAANDTDSESTLVNLVSTTTTTTSGSGSLGWLFDAIMFTALLLSARRARPRPVA